MAVFRRGRPYYDQQDEFKGCTLQQWAGKEAAGCGARADGEQRRVQAAGGRGSAGLLPFLSPITTVQSLVVFDFGGAVS